MRHHRAKADLLDAEGNVLASDVVVLLEADEDTWWGRLGPEIDTTAFPQQGRIRLEGNGVAEIRYTGDLGDETPTDTEAKDIDLVGSGPPPF